LEHPTRARALSIINEGDASPKMIAAELGLPVGTVGHHVKRLEELGCVKLVKTKPRRGATEHFYRGMVRSVLDEDQWARLDPDAKKALSIEWWKMLTKAVKEALVARTFDARNDRHLSRTPVTVDEQGWKELMKLLEDTSEEIQEIGNRSAEREESGDSSGPFFHATVAMLGFETPDPRPEGTH
jgi:predicted ArsR family transcriptional regulator